MLVGLNSGTLRMEDVFQAVRWVRENGFDTIELSCDPGPGQRARVSAADATEEFTSRLREACAAFPTVTIHGPWMTFPGFSLLSGAEGLRARSLQEIKTCVDFAAALGASVVTFHSGFPDKGTTDGEALEIAGRSLDDLDEHAARQKVRMGLEVVNFFQTAERWETFPWRWENIGITLDLGHISFPHPTRPGCPSYSPLRSIGEFIERFGERIVHLHAHDYDGAQDHLAIGAGKVDLPEIVRALKRTRYAGAICLELWAVTGAEGLVTSLERMRQLLTAEGLA